MLSTHTPKAVCSGAQHTNRVPRWTLTDDGKLVRCKLRLTSDPKQKHIQPESHTTQPLSSIWPPTAELDLWCAHCTSGSVRLRSLWQPARGSVVWEHLNYGHVHASKGMITTQQDLSMSTSINVYFYPITTQQEDLYISTSTNIYFHLITTQQDLYISTSINIYFYMYLCCRLHNITIRKPD